ncbi:hypothetical protein [uncultured Actinomyces sp.]|uniref:hypothetical protein n=1 Tax=uncultured Actinomyces sp. TaxID=249061 RepID=UPI002607FD97|nr:hypothetical protein [uncultured Actinomyces sp.]
MPRRQAAVLGVVALLLTGCAHASDPAAQTGNGTYGPQVMVPRDDLVSPVPVRWKSWRAVDDTTIEVTYFAGPASCQGVHALVEQTPQAVTITLSTGALPGSGDCMAVALSTITTITLNEPLAGRQVIQGS